MQETAGVLIAVSILGAVFGLIVQYLLIRFAVKHGTEDALRELDLSRPSSIPRLEHSVVPDASAPAPAPAPAEEKPPDEQLMTQYGITFDGEQYHYGQYRYDTLEHAVDYARKQAHP